MFNAKKAYLDRKAAKLAKKNEEKEKFKAQRDALLQSQVEKNTRKPEEIEKALDASSGNIGKLYHQQKCLEAELNNKTQEFHNLLIELDKSLKIYPKAVVLEETPTAPEETIDAI